MGVSRSAYTTVPRRPHNRTVPDAGHDRQRTWKLLSTARRMKAYRQMKAGSGNSGSRLGGPLPAASPANRRSLPLPEGSDRSPAKSRWGGRHHLPAGPGILYLNGLAHQLPVAGDRLLCRGPDRGPREEARRIPPTREASSPVHSRYSSAWMAGAGTRTTYLSSGYGGLGLRIMALTPPRAATSNPKIRLVFHGEPVGS